MLKTFLALAAGALIAAAPSTTSAATLQAHRVTADGGWVGQASVSLAAYRVGHDAGLTLRSDDGSTRRLAAPEGCVLTGVGGGLAAGRCGTPIAVPNANAMATELVVTRLDGTLAARFTVPLHVDPNFSAVPGPPVAVGEHWIALRDGAKQGGFWWQDVDWRTHAVRPVYEERADRVDDLDAADLEVPLCAPVRRFSRGEPDMNRYPIHSDAQVRGGWVLLQRDHDDVNFTIDHVLRRCGAAKPVTLPKGFDARALGDGFVAGYTTVARRSPRLEVIRLSDRRQFTVSSGAGKLTDGALSFTHRQLYVSTGTTLLTAVLPKA
jgi:hypothetical protein